MAVVRYTAEHPCPVCHGHQKLPQGQGIRCFGFASDDGWCLCTREGGGNAPWKEEARGWSHRIEGDCPCGTQHGADSSLPPARRMGGEVREIGEAKRAQIVATYDYRSSKGVLLYQVVRYSPKTFKQRRPHPTKEGEWVWHMLSCEDARKNGSRCRCGLPAQPHTLYHIPEVVQGLEAGDTLWIAEGEKDVDALRAAGCIATCNSGGTGKWRDAFAAFIAKHVQPDGKVVVVQDRDPDFDTNGKPHRAGQQHAMAVLKSLREVVPETVQLSIVEAIEGKDAADHLGAGHGIDDFKLVYPEPEVLFETDPAGYKRLMLRKALTMTMKSLEAAGLDPGEEPERPPQFWSPLRGSKPYPKLQGVVTIAGAPSAGKSYFALGAAVDNALDPDNPWDVYYLSCEMPKEYAFDRVLRAAASIDLTYYDCSSPEQRRRAVEWAKSQTIPARFQLVQIELGIRMEEVIDYLANVVGPDPTLVVLDSISSFVDNMDEVRGDSFGMSNLRTVQRFATAVRRMTGGHIAWIILSELNKEGRAKGRSLDHRSDLAIAMAPDPQQGQVKQISITKSWFSPTGPLGPFVLHHDISRLVSVDDA